MVAIQRRPPGIALAVVIIAVLLVAVLVGAVASTDTRNLQFEARNLLNQRALCAAQAGLQDGCSQLLLNTAWSGTSPTLSNQPMPHRTADSFTVTVTNNTAGAASVTATDGTTVPAGYAYLVSLGLTNTNDYVWRQVHRTATELVRVTGYFGKFGVYANRFTLAGTNLFDSYDSSAGVYAEPTVPLNLWSALGSGLGGLTGLDASSTHQASVGTNSTSAGAINITGTSYIDGNLTVGVGGNPSQVVSGINLTSVLGNSVSGTAAAASTPWPLPAVTVPSSIPGPNDAGTTVTAAMLSSQVLPPGTYGSMDLGALSNVTLQSGTYHFTGSITASAAATINLSLSGSGVTLYLDGDWNTSSVIININNPSKLASNFLVYATGSSQISMLGLSSSTFMAMYAPSADVSVLGNAEIMGAVVANSITSVGGLEVHYDTALSRLDNPPLLQQIGVGVQ